MSIEREVEHVQRLKYLTQEYPCCLPTIEPECALFFLQIYGHKLQITDTITIIAPSQM